MTEADTVEKPILIELVSLQSSNQGYCIEITSIREIRRWNSVTPLPNSDPATLGVMNLRGAVIPILDLASHLGMPKTEIGGRSVVVGVVGGRRRRDHARRRVAHRERVRDEDMRPLER